MNHTSHHSIEERVEAMINSYSNFPQKFYGGKSQDFALHLVKNGVECDIELFDGAPRIKGSCILVEGIIKRMASLEHQPIFLRDEFKNTFVSCTIDYAFNTALAYALLNPAIVGKYYSAPVPAVAVV